MKRTLIAVIAAGMCMSVVPDSVRAQDYLYEQDFSARRVSVEDIDPDGPFITIQIDPDEQAAMLALPEENEFADEEIELAALVEPEPDSGSTALWFWDMISADISAANPGRVLDAAALVAISTDQPEARTPRLATLQNVTRDYGVDILRETVGTRVSPAMVVAVIAVESAGQSDAESSAGAVGLMQLMPAAAERFGVEDRTDPQQSIAGGVAYLDLLMETFGNDPVLALAAYNAGENAVLSRGKVPEFPETRAYVPKVLAAWNVARNLCRTPPMLMSDGCLFISVGG